MAAASEPQEPAQVAGGAGTGEPSATGPAEPPGGAGPGQSHACFSSLDLSRVRKTLSRLHEQVAFGRGRIEIRRRGCDDVCVMISKAELEALESALEILTASAEYKAMCDTLSQVAAATGGYASAQPCGG